MEIKSNATLKLLIMISCLLWKLSKRVTVPLLKSKGITTVKIRMSGNLRIKDQDLPMPSLEIKLFD